MNPNELRKAVDPEWPMDVRFLIKRAAESWEEDVEHERVIQRDLVKYMRHLAKQLSGGLWHRIRGKDYQTCADNAEELCRRVEEGPRYLSAEEEDHGKEDVHSEDA